MEGVVHPKTSKIHKKNTTAKLSCHMIVLKENPKDANDQGVYETKCNINNTCTCVRASITNSEWFCLLFLILRIS